MYQANGLGEIRAPRPARHAVCEPGHPNDIQTKKNKPGSRRRAPLGVSASRSIPAHPGASRHERTAGTEAQRWNRNAWHSNFPPTKTFLSGPPLSPRLKRRTSSFVVVSGTTGKETRLIRLDDFFGMKCGETLIFCNVTDWGLIIAGGGGIENRGGKKGCSW